MPKEKGWEERFDKEFGDKYCGGEIGEIWNGKKGLPDGMTIKSFISSELQKCRDEVIDRAITECLKHKWADREELIKIIKAKV